MEEVRQRQQVANAQAHEEKIKEQERQAQASMMNQSLQLAQMAVVTHLVSSLTGRAQPVAGVNIPGFQTGTVQGGNELTASFTSPCFSRRGRAQ